MILYFIFMWCGTFGFMFWLNRRYGHEDGYDYETAVVQSFTAASNK